MKSKLFNEIAAKDMIIYVDGQQKVFQKGTVLRTVSLTDEEARVLNGLFTGQPKSSTHFTVYEPVPEPAKVEKNTDNEITPMEPKRTYVKK
jgi:hypothetical protein